MTLAIETRINQRWTLRLPEHRAARPEWSAPGWEVIRLDSMCANIKPGMLVYDVGTEEGDLSALYASWGARLVLCEPNERVLSNPRFIWEANGLPMPVACFAGFVCDDDHDVDRGLHVGSWPSAAYGEVIGDHGFRVVTQSPQLPRVRIDTLTERLGPPDAITADIEGCELLMLRGAEMTLKNHRPLVWISVHPTFMADTFRHRVTDLWEYLSSCGYRWRLLDYDHELHVFAVHRDRAPIGFPP